MERMTHQLWEQIVERMEALDWSQTRLAKEATAISGKEIKQQNVSRILKAGDPSIADGPKPKRTIVHSRDLQHILSALGINKPVATLPRIVLNDTIRSRTPIDFGEIDLPVRSWKRRAMGGIVVSTDSAEMIRRPKPLVGVKDGYGLFVELSDMIPAFWPGDTVLVHPHLPPINNSDVLLYRHDGDESPAVLVHLRCATDDEWHVCYWDGSGAVPREVTFKRSEWPICHRIVGKYARG